MARESAKQSIDVRGKTITTFILYEAVMKLSEMGEGGVLEVVTDAFEPIGSDIRAWCRMTGHGLVGFDKGADQERYYIRKGAPVEQERKLALVISDAGLEELISPLGFALGAAVAGSEVYIYFQGPAVRVLKRGFKETLRGISRPFSGFARKGLADVGHIPPQDKLRQLRRLGASFYMCGPSMEHFGVKKDELIFDDVVVSEYLTFLEVMGEADIRIYTQ
jgi:predicted peroxiredoxin/TusA-related sulfurtransferase